MTWGPNFWFTSKGSPSETRDWEHWNYILRKVQISASYIMRFILKMVLVVFCAKIDIESVVYNVNCVLVAVRSNMLQCKLQKLRMKMGKG